MNAKYLVIGALLIAPSVVQAQAHAGQTDTDGILSPGEQLNRGIDYDRAQREGEMAGDPRVENPSNDTAAARDRDMHRGQLGLPTDRRDRDSDRDYDYRSREEHRRWWRWW